MNEENLSRRDFLREASRVIVLSLAAGLTGSTPESGPEIPFAPEEWVYCSYPFFEIRGSECYEYSTNIADNGAGKVNEYWDPNFQGSQDPDKRICFLVASIQLHGAPEDSEVEFTPDCCPTKGCSGFQTESWNLKGAPGYEEEPPIIIISPLPATRDGVLTISGQEYRLRLIPGENVIFLAPPSDHEALTASGIDTKLQSITQTIDSKTDNLPTHVFIGDREIVKEEDGWREVQ
ncbi:hypothetical protein COT75_03535 [Candidatus Beckwithbacteria bacterium CG10_big_fil_rev_8_21_14_0_10_34_10]|uniref:Uncharacterized protein n=1 Tax=Candidatus Beckwithbacteria bacterium CG10_big_fil_rev_8_21_14_0_10_34_10 TaxID=1974495 RepID=A0A2H0W915_9BACT|nr:MAG: hypothetical protein COT75_03535 [Candidatus Beckwithbacteria bacterium CG10_big_fil_rev_8_21_14_0_10_34_10]